MASASSRPAATHQPGWAGFSASPARLAAATKNLAALVDATARQQDLSNARTAEAEAAGQLSAAERRLRNVTAWLDRYGDARPAVTIRRAATPTTAPSNE